LSERLGAAVRELEQVCPSLREIVRVDVDGDLTLAVPQPSVAPDEGPAQGAARERAA
jgi:hypothetical protein